jgi:hypothetical protein
MILLRELIKMNVKFINNLSKRLYSRRPQLLNLGEIQRLLQKEDFKSKYITPNNNELKKITGNDVRVRCVNIGAKRIKNTPADAPNNNNQSLHVAVHSHVNGSSERTNEANKSAVISLTSDMNRALAYGAYYLQIFPVSVLVFVRPRMTEKTTNALEDGKTLPITRNIANKHEEYFPKKVSYIPSTDILQIIPAYINPGGDYRLSLETDISHNTQEYWVKNKGIYENEIHQQEARSKNKSSTYKDISNFIKQGKRKKQKRTK